MATSSPKDPPEVLMDQAQALIDRVQSELESSEDFYRSQGLAPEKVRAVLQGELTPQGRQEAEQAFASDMDAVEQEVREELARTSFAAPPQNTNTVRRRRPMV